MGGLPRIAVIIPTRNAASGHAEKCIPIVKRTTAHLNVDLQVVESSGSDFRFSRSINIGIARAPDADAWVLLNDDAFMDDGWLDAMLETSHAHPEVGVVGALLRYPDGRIQHAGGHLPVTPREFLAVAMGHRAPLWALRELARHGFAKRAYMFAHHQHLDARNRLDFVTGACYLITKACMEAVGPFDERYGFGAEDADHSLRALEAGFEIALATKATGVHLDGGSSTHASPKQLASFEAFHQRWNGEVISALTRRNRRTGIYNPVPGARA